MSRALTVSILAICRGLVAVSTVLLVLSAWAGDALWAQTAHLSSAQSYINVQGGLAWPQEVAVDGNGNLYVADANNHRVVMLTPSAGGYAQSTIGTGWQSPYGVAVDANDNVYIADIFASTLFKETPNGSGGYTQTTIGNNLYDVVSLAVDHLGNVYGVSINNSFVGTPFVETLSGGSYTQTYLSAPGTHGVNSVVVDGQGNLFLNDSYDNGGPAGGVYEDSPLQGGGYATTHILTTPGALAVDANNDLYVAGYPGNIVELTPSGGGNFTETYFPTDATLTPYGYFDAAGLAVDGNGDIFFTDLYTDSLLEEKQGTGDFGQVSVGSTSYPVTMFFTFDTSGTLGQTAVLTQGAPSLDFTDAQTGNCYGGSSYNAGSTCMVAVSLTPAHPGPRYGSVELLDGSGNLFATGYAQGTGVGPQATFATIDTASGAYLPTATSTLGSGFQVPEGVAVDGSGNVFVGDAHNQAVKEIVAAGGYTTVNTLGGNYSYPSGIAVDGSGNVFIADSGHNAIKEILAAGGYSTVNTLATANGDFSNPTGVAVDGSGNVFVGDSGNNAVKEIFAVGGYTTVNTLSSGFSNPVGVAVDGSANVFVADDGNAAVKEILAAGGYTTVKTLGSGFNHPFGVVVDASGNVFVGDSANNAVKEILAAGGYTTVQTVGGGLSGPKGLALNGYGGIYVADTSNNAVKVLAFDYLPSLNFATTVPGQTSTDSPQTVTVINDGNANLAFSALSYPKDFPEASGVATDCTASSVVAAGTDCTLSIDFTPQPSSLSGASTLLNESVSLTTDSLNVTTAQSVALSGKVTAAQVSLTSPAGGSILVGPTVFTWSPGAGSAMFALWIGTSPGTNNLYTSGHVANTVTSETVNIPANGATIYVSLWYEVNSSWTYKSYTFTEAAPPSLTSPTSSPISGATTFTWNPGTASTMFALWIGTSPGTNNLYTSGHVANTVTSETVGIPANGATLYVSLWYEVNSSWTYKSYTFTEAKAPALTSPTSSPLSGSTQFTWSPGTGSSMFALWIGTSAGTNNLYTSGHVANTVTSETVNIPVNGATLYVSLWYELNGVWAYKSYTFTEAAPPSLTSPTSSPLSASTTFTWNPGTAAPSMFALWIGTSPGTNNFYTSGHVANTVTSETVNIPANGATLYVSLWYELNGNWIYKSYTFTEAP